MNYKRNIHYIQRRVVSFKKQLFFLYSEITNRYVYVKIVEYMKSTINVVLIFVNY